MINMADVIHKYYCIRCEKFLYSDSRLRLAIDLNYHNTAQHPADFAAWTERNIISSMQYVGEAGPLPQYLEAHGTTSKRVLTITDEDRAMLKAGGVAW
jgi:hypothetical protein